MLYVELEHKYLQKSIVTALLNRLLL